MSSAVRHAMFRSVTIVIIATAYSCAAFSTHTNSWRTSSGSKHANGAIEPLVTTSSTAGSQPTTDVVLSSGNCAYAAHCGFLEGVERILTRSGVGAIVGTSSGALVGNPSISTRDAVVKVPGCVLNISKYCMMRADTVLLQLLSIRVVVGRRILRERDKSDYRAREQRRRVSA